MKACATGQHIKVAMLSARKAGKGQQDYLTFKFYDVLISSFQTAGIREREPRTRRIRCRSTSEDRHGVQAAEGGRHFAASVHFKYDLKANKTF